MSDTLYRYDPTNPNACYPQVQATRLGDLRDVVAHRLADADGLEPYMTPHSTHYRDADTAIAALGGEDALIVRGDKP